MLEDATAIKSRLMKYLKSKRIKLAQLERKAGLANAYLRNSNGAIGATKLREILLVCTDLNANWLLTGEGDMLKTNGTEVQYVNGQNAKGVYKGNMTINEKEELETLPRITIENFEELDPSELPSCIAEFINDVKELKRQYEQTFNDLTSLKNKYDGLLEKYEEKSDNLDRAKDQIIELYRLKAESK